jgi:hypothetical protein
MQVSGGSSLGNDLIHEYTVQDIFNEPTAGPGSGKTGYPIPELGERFRNNLGGYLHGAPLMPDVSSRQDFTVAAQDGRVYADGSYINS